MNRGWVKMIDPRKCVKPVFPDAHFVMCGECGFVYYTRVINGKPKDKCPVKHQPRPGSAGDVR